MTFTDDGSVNFHKLTEIGQILKLIELAQSAVYDLKEDSPIQEYLKHVFVLSKSVMFAVSEQCLANLKRQKFLATQNSVSMDLH